MKEFAYQKSERYFAQIADGMEEAGAAELSRLGALDLKPAYRGVHFKAGNRTLYAINYESRLITRVLAPLLTFDCHSSNYLYKTAGNIDWPRLMTVENTFAVSATVSNSNIRHSQYASLRVKDAIADQFRAAVGSRPNVDTEDPDLRIVLYIHGNRAAIHLDTSGGSLHRRGYRRETVDAPIQETVAAAILEHTGWDGTRSLYDPMCGSGTILAEALMMARRLPAAFLRKKFGFRHLPDYDEKIWRSVKEDADSRVRPLPESLLAGSDISSAAVGAARANLRALPDGRSVRVNRCDFRKIPALEEVVIVCNPPYGIRSSPGADLSGFMKEFGDFLKQRCRGSEAYIYFGEREWIKKIGLRSSWKKPLKTGGLDGRLVKYELY